MGFLRGPCVKGACTLFRLFYRFGHRFMTFYRSGTRRDPHPWEGGGDTCHPMVQKWSRSDPPDDPERRFVTARRGIPGLSLTTHCKTAVRLLPSVAKSEKVAAQRRIAMGFWTVLYGVKRWTKDGHFSEMPPWTGGRTGK